MPMDDSHLLEQLIEAAVAAGRATWSIYESDFDVVSKADATPVTAADHAAEAMILKALEQAAPELPVVAEEEVAAGRIPAVGRAFFLVDPLDGTKEFVSRLGDFTINIALIRDGEPVLGVVYAPARGLLYTGNVPEQVAHRFRQTPASNERGRAERIHVRPVPAAGLVAVASRSHRTPETDAYLAQYQLVDSVSIGSSLKFCMVAAGEADLYPRLGPTMEWDTAAAQAVLVAAGGRVIAADGEPLRYGKPGFRNPYFVASGGFEPRPIEH